MPDVPHFEFLKARGMRIKTIRLRGQISQGICFPITILPPDFKIEEDVDCTEVLGITKYEPPVPANLLGIAKGKFPSFIPKTDETRVQVLQEMLDNYKGEKCYITEKLDGSSVTYFYKDGEFGVCSRNLELLEDTENSMWKYAREQDLENKMKGLNKNIAFQGEIVGEGIQSNKLKIKAQSVRFFNVFDIDKYSYLAYEEMKSLFANLNLEMVPVISEDYQLENDIDAIIKMATIKSIIQKDAWAEGIVIRPYEYKKEIGLSNEYTSGGRVSFKAINPEFLIKYGE
jgi:RNA ligase (TIGR02306 family)